MQRHPGLLDDLDDRNHFHHRMFHAHDADRALLRIGCMSMALHGVINPEIRYTSNVAPDTERAEGRYTVLLAHPSTSHLPVTASPSSIVQAEIHMVTRCLSLLKRGGRAAVVVPRHILTGTSASHLALRRSLMEEQHVDGVIGVTCGFSPACPAAPTAILLFTRTDCGGPEYVRFHGAPQRVLNVMHDWQGGGAGGASDAERTAGTLVHKRHLGGAGNFLASGRHAAQCHPTSCIRGASRHAIPHDMAVAQDCVRFSS